MNRYRFYIGLLDHAGAPADHTGAHAYLAAHFGGYLALEGNGAWQPPDGPVLYEPSMVYECIADGPHPAASYAADLAQLCNQACVLWTAEHIEGGFANA